MMASFWSEYDYAAEWSARNGYAGNVGDPLPEYLSGVCVGMINDDPEAFQVGVRACRYALAMNRHNLPANEE